MQSRNRKLKRILAGQQNPKSNASKIGGISEQIIILKKGKFEPRLSKEVLDEKSDEQKAAMVRNRNKVYTKSIVHQM